MSNSFLVTIIIIWTILFFFYVFFAALVFFGLYQAIRELQKVARTTNKAIVNLFAPLIGIITAMGRRQK